MGETTGRLDGGIFGDDQPCFGCGPAHPHGMRLAFEREGDEVVCRYVPRGDQQGPPGIMHGGLVATFADEVAAWAVIAILGKFGFTVSLQGRYPRAARVGVPLEGRARVLKETSRLVDVALRVLQDGAEVFTGEFRFVLVDEKGAERLLGGPLPEAWKRFCR